LHLDLHAVLVDDRQLESTALEPLEVDDVAVLVPEQDLEHVAALPDEDEEMSLVRIPLEDLLDDRAQPVDAVAHVDQAGRKVDAHTWWKSQHQPPSSTAMARANASSSKPRPTLMMCPLRKYTATGWPRFAGADSVTCPA